MTDYDMRAGGRRPSPLSLRMTLTLSAAMALIDRTLGIGPLLADHPREPEDAHFERLRHAFEELCGVEGCLQMALNPTHAFDPDGLETHPRTIAWHIAQLGATRVLELGSGAGFNTLLLARDHPGVTFVGLDPLPRHRDLARARARDRGIANARFEVGRLDKPGAGGGDFDLVFGVERLGQSPDIDRLLAAVAGVMRPGGRYLHFDTFLHEDIADQPRAMVEALRLHEGAEARAGGFRTLSAWHRAIGQAGLVVRRDQDLTANILPLLLRSQARAAAALGRTRRRADPRPPPTPDGRALAAALVAPLLYCGPGPQPMPPLGMLRYVKIVAHRPR
ncbi:MAG: class I SAM-dependent methyltransferase [Rhodobacteraceae bacterium]|nr:class I SAM-dependent methyltransferase [Paracoccaceae bacterium]